MNMEEDSSSKEYVNTVSATPEPIGYAPKLENKKPQVRNFSEEEDKTQEALGTFTELPDCEYADEFIGSYKSNDFMECDCYEDFQNGENHACDEDSDCINRLTLIECVNDLCGTCGDDCQNQRFQRKQYAEIAVFKTKMKGYGVRAEEDIPENSFIYEYKGEVIHEDAFRVRLVEYDEKKFQHFYFMMLQSGEFIDATIKGSLARFCNHSCNPNAYVNKWVVAGKLRMGIFAKRRILKGEEITFDYNVDRYGAAAQKCYCEEPNCIGFLGGKTQTDAASLLPQNVADALGIKASQEKKWIKEKKSRGEEIEKIENENINIEFLNSIDIEPCNNESDVRKVISVLLQVENKQLAAKLFDRLYLSTNEDLLHQVLKLHGYTCFAKLLQLFNMEKQMLTKLLEFLLKLPKTTKNGILSSHIDNRVKEIGIKFDDLFNISKDLIEKWKAYEEYKMISKKDIKGSNNISILNLRRVKLPPGWEVVFENGRPMYYNAEKQTKLLYPPSGSTKTFGTSMNKSQENLNSEFTNPTKRKLTEKEYEERKKRRLQKEEEMIQKAKKEELDRLKAKIDLEKQQKRQLEQIIEEANRRKKQELEELEKSSKLKEVELAKKKQKLESNQFEYRWTRFFASFVPNMLRKYEVEDHLSHYDIKKCSRDIVKILASKEMKKDSLRQPPDDISNEKKTKVKHFIKIYMEKFIQKLERKKTKSKT
ncbi:Histone-lysine N-methyltransferase, H3 lysine-36 specific [Nakaseomyces bracarensis]|uniref:Histone-lysine N-methyltransferase, H3 lysine-36 specific n=1 Tax=Nakaseomyces bracarensis TaxID=273131 RepID=A0ABR4NTY6_9SACH